MTMRESDLPAFIAAIEEVRQLLAPRSAALTPSAQALWWRTLVGYDLPAIQAALDAHVADPIRGCFPPVPADVTRHLEAARSDGRPGPEEAWAIALAARDEAETVVWTDETAAAFQACRAVLDAGDEVGARMAFREAYTRLLGQSRAAGAPCNWTACLGWDVERRRDAIVNAVDAGLLPRTDLEALPAPATAALLPPPAGGEASMGPKEREARAKLRQWVAETIERAKAGQTIDTSARDALSPEQRAARHLLRIQARQWSERQQVDLMAAAVELAARQDAMDEAVHKAIVSGESWLAPDGRVLGPEDVRP